MTEQWYGTYTFGKDYPAQLCGLSFAFTIDWNIDKECLTGTCLDEDTSDFFDAPAVIAGSRKGKRIKFTKKYPLFWEVDLEGMAYVDHTRPSAPVAYTGLQRDDYMEGKWKIAVAHVDPTGHIEQAKGSGTWMMHRIA